nr:BrxA/BrxB family bacilliredoxin [Saprospiraceae bacterium]
MYPLELVAPIAQDLTDFGFESLSTPAEVDAALESKDGTVLL